MISITRGGKAVLVLVWQNAFGSWSKRVLGRCEQMCLRVVFCLAWERSEVMFGNVIFVKRNRGNETIFNTLCTIGHLNAKRHYWSEHVSQSSNEPYWSLKIHHAFSSRDVCFHAKLTFKKRN